MSKEFWSELAVEVRFMKRDATLFRVFCSLDILVHKVVCRRLRILQHRQASGELAFHQCRYRSDEKNVIAGCFEQIFQAPLANSFSPGAVDQPSGFMASSSQGDAALKGGVLDQQFALFLSIYASTGIPSLLPVG